MITLTTAAADAVERGYVLRCRASSWLSDELLTDDIPVDDGSEEADRSLRIPERITLTVPREDGGTSWDPAGDVAHPLAPFGQTLTIDLGIELQAGVTEWLRRGEFLISSTELQGDTVNVEAVGMLQLIEEARFVSPFQPTGTFVSTVRDLVEPAITVEVDSALTDRAVPGSMNWDENRLDGLWELLDAWPADAYIRPDGVLYVTSVADPASSYSITDDTGGTVVQWSSGASRDGGTNCVVARGQLSDGTQVQGVAYDTDTASALRFGGPFNKLAVPFYFESPLLTTAAQCRSAARSILARRRRSSAQTLTATHVPHPGLLVGDTITATGAGLTDTDTALEVYRLPYSAEGGAAESKLRVLT